MSTINAVKNLVKSRQKIQSRIESIKSKCEKKILMSENEMKQIDKALEALSDDVVDPVRKAS